MSEFEAQGLVILAGIIGALALGAWMIWDDAKRKRTQYKHNDRNPK